MTAIVPLAEIHYLDGDKKKIADPGVVFNAPDDLVDQLVKDDHYRLPTDDEAALAEARAAAVANATVAKKKKSALAPPSETDADSSDKDPTSDL